MASSDPSDPAAAAADHPDHAPVNLQAAYEGADVHQVLDQLDRELIGLQPVKTRIREIAALLVVDRARKQVGLATTAPSLHMSFTGRPGTGPPLRPGHQGRHRRPDEGTGVRVGHAGHPRQRCRPLLVPDRHECCQHLRQQ